VCGHHDRLGTGNGSLKARDDVAGISSDLFACVVYLNLRAHLFAMLLDALGNLAFLSRVAVNLDEFE
jgi:hypothetical protein